MAQTLKRAALKFLEVMCGIGGLCLFWRYFPGFARSGYGPFFATVQALLPFVIVIVALAVLFTEWRLGPGEKTDWRTRFLGWVVRGIFLPLNFTALVTFIGRFRGMEAEVFTAPWPQAEYRLLMMVSATLAAAIVPGYLFGSRLLGTHIRKVDATLSGWLVTLSCYPPLMSVVFLHGLNFYPHIQKAPWGQPWIAELGAWPALALGTGIIVMGLEVIHYWGEAAFGLRASNLSNRGIITNGPYRFFKHPIYLVKCVIWLLWMPFLAGGTALECAWLTFLWACVCGIYFMRAWVEERLLCEDPDYVAYALWMDENGFLAQLGRVCPVLQFAWRIERWK